MFNIDEQLNSYLNFTLGLNKNISAIVDIQFLKPKIENFFIHKKILNYQLINTSKLPTLHDFKYFEMKYYYELLFSDITKVNGEITYYTKYGFTLDEENCNLTCTNTDIKYGEILIYNKPVFYFIYFDIKDIFNFIKNHINVDRKEYKNLKV